MGDGVWILLRSRYDELLDDELSAADLIAAPGLLRADWPWLDRWAVSLLDDRHASSPWPRLWPTPLDCDGWLLALEDEAATWQPNIDAKL